MKRCIRLFVLCFFLFLVLWGVGCGGNKSMNGACPQTNISITVCDPDAGPFSLTIDNSFFPVVVGNQNVLEGEDDEGAMIRLEISVLDETEEVAGVTARVVEEREFVDGELVEVSRNFFAQAPEGTVCYFGEDVDIFEGGVVVSHEGAWRAGENANLPGIIMPANPEVGMVFSQESAPGIAEDQAEVIALGETIEVPAGTFDDTLTTEDCNPLGGGAKDNKVYVRGIGLSIDEDADLISF